MSKLTTPVFKKEYFLFLLPVFFVWHGYVENYNAVPVTGGLWLIIKYIVAGLVIAFLFFLFFKSWRKAAVFSFCILAFDFFFGAMHDSLKKMFPESFLVKYTFILPAALILFIIVFICIKKTKFSFDGFTKYLNILLILLIIYDIVQFSVKISKQPSKTGSAFQYNIQKCDTCTTPDVYLIIADEYAGHKELKDQFGFDNSAFESALTSKGFYIVPNSSANYNFTPYAMASLLNMDYLKGIDNYVSSKKGLTTAYNTINKNATVDFFKAIGYKFINNSIFKVDGIAAETEQGALTDKENLITNQTFTSRLYKDIGYHLVTTLKIRSITKNVTYTDQRNNNLLIENLLKESSNATVSQPRFIYTHLMMPHYPYYINEKGETNPLDSITEGNQNKMNYYLEYLKYCNNTFLDIIDNVLSNTRKQSIIIFMSDHGFREFTAQVDHLYQFMNLNAIFLPGRNHGSFEGVSNVNQFRTLLNTQFGQHIPLLKDSTIFLEEK